jgi:hypothetical protein
MLVPAGDQPREAGGTHRTVVLELIVTVGPSAGMRASRFAVGLELAASQWLALSV